VAQPGSGVDGREAPCRIELLCRPPHTSTLGPSFMHSLLAQIEGSLHSGHYFLSLFAALSVPDIAGALSSTDGTASSKKYEAWYEEWVRPRFFESVLAGVPAHARPHISHMENPLTGAACYQFRCSLLHQGSSQHPKSPFSRIIFIEPGATSNTVHYCTMNDALCIDLSAFCSEVVGGGRAWLQEAATQEAYVKNYERFARRHEGGLAPYIVGVPVIG